MTTKYCLFVLVLVSMSSSSLAQDYPGLAQQDLSEKYGSETDFYPCPDIYSKKINLNHINEQELSAIGILNSLQIESLFRHLRTYGPFLSLYELQSIEGFDLQTIEEFKNVLADDISSEDDSVNDHDLFSQGKHDLLFRWGRTLETQSGYAVHDQSRFLGSPWKMVASYQFNFRNKIMFFWLGEKDPGEEFFKGTQKQGFDFNTCHIALKNFRWIKSFIIGDYNLHFGQGLSLWNGFSVPKTTQILQLPRVAEGIYPYHSANENNNFRGCAGTFHWKKTECALFFSQVKRDANLSEDSSGSITGLLYSGYHRNLYEWKKRQRISQTVFGTHLSYQAGNWKAGITSCRMMLSKPIENSDKPYRYWMFRGMSLQNTALDFSCFFRNIYGWTEFTWKDKNMSSYAHIAGILMALDEKLSFSLLWRNYAVDYYSPYSNAFAESDINNEWGLYQAIHYRLYSFWEVSAYVDFFRFPFLKYAVDKPSGGKDVVILSAFSFGKTLKINLRYTNKQQEKNVPAFEGKVNPILETYRNDWRADFEYVVNPQLKINSKVLYRFYADEQSNRATSSLLFQGLTYRFGSKAGSIEVGMSVFRSEQTYPGIYLFEKDLFSNYHSVYLQGKGQRIFLIYKINPFKSVNLMVQYDESFFPEQKSTGSGLEKINNCSRSEFKMQLILHF